MAGIDKKYVDVWKLNDGVSKQDFQHWCDAIDSNLEAAQRLPLPEIVLEKVRRSAVSIEEGNWQGMISQASTELENMKKAARERAEEDSKKQGRPILSTDPVMVAPADLGEAWKFEKSRFLWTFLLNKLNTELHGKSIGIEGRSGFELYRQVA